MSRLFLITCAAVAIGAWGLPTASAQKASPHPVQMAQAQAMSRASLGPNRWACASQANMEVAPVSSDVSVDQPAYVLIYRHDGAPVASQRISAQDVAALKRLGCPTKATPADRPEMFVGG